MNTFCWVQYKTCVCKTLYWETVKYKHLQNKLLQLTDIKVERFVTAGGYSVVQREHIFVSH